MRFRWLTSPTVNSFAIVALVFAAAEVIPYLRSSDATPGKTLHSEIARAFSREGTWKLALDHSMYSPGPAPRSGIRTVEMLTNGRRQRTEGVDALGNRVAYEYTASYDGKDYAITGTGVPNEADTIALAQIDNSTVESTLKKNGKVVLRVRSVLSKDGRMLTYTAKGADLVTGEPITNVTNWERQ